MSGAVLNSRFLTRLLTSGEEDIERISMLKEDIASTACELTMLISSILCYIQCDLFDCCMFSYTKPFQQSWPMHSCSFYKSALSDWRYGGRL